MSDFFESTVSISKIDKNDVKIATPNYKLFLHLIKLHEPMYPNIGKWVQEKVRPGLLSGERIAYLGFDGDNPIATAVVKVGNISKFCHLHIKDEYRHNNLGEIFFIMMALDVRHCAKSVYFTLPEGLWSFQKKFFESFSFNSVSKSKIQYRKGEEELFCETSYSSLFNAVQSKLPKLIAKNSLGYDNYVNGLIFSLKPQYAKQIIYGNKRVELRRKFNSSYVNRKVYLYATSPQKQIVGTARIQSIVKDKPDRIWETFKDLIGCDKNEFDSYSNNCAQISAIQLTEVSALDAPFGLTFLESVSQTNLTPPQSYFQINSNENWLKAISIYELTRKNFCAYHI